MREQTLATKDMAQVGDVVAGRYKVTGIVGKGAMGSIFAAEHCTTGQAVALKFMLTEGEGDEFVARFEQEARVMASLRHPNTIRIYDFGQTDSGALFMAMELLHGQGLDSYIRENTRLGKTMSEVEAADYCTQILKALEEAHRQGLVHRDLKPGNIFLTDDGSGETLCKVLDFGIARVEDSEMTNAGRILGTPSYMSPEQWRGGTIDARSDLYAVGCILYCCVTGSPPFTVEGGSPYQMMHKHLNEQPEDPRKRARQPLSDAFLQVVTTAMSKDVERRYVDARSMRQALQAAAGGAWAGTPAAISPGTPWRLELPKAADHGKRKEKEQAAPAGATMVLAGDNASFEPTLPMSTTAASLKAAPGTPQAGGGAKWMAALAVVAAAGGGAWWALGPGGAQRRPAPAPTPIAEAPNAAPSAPDQLAAPVPPQAPAQEPQPSAAVPPGETAGAAAPAGATQPDAESVAAESDAGAAPAAVDAVAAEGADAAPASSPGTALAAGKQGASVPDKPDAGPGTAAVPGPGEAASGKTPGKTGPGTAGPTKIVQPGRTTAGSTTGVAIPTNIQSGTTSQRNDASSKEPKKDAPKLEFLD